MGFQLNPAVGAALGALMGANPPPALAVGDVNGRRALLDGTFAALAATQPTVADVDVKEFALKAEDGHELNTRWYTKKSSPSPGSAVLYNHGGGMIALSIDVYDGIVKRYVSNTGVPMLIVDYRLAPEVQAPTPVTDCLVGFNYLHANAKDLAVDPVRIAIMGDSAGGGITAALAHLLKKNGGPQASKQILIYPMLDDRNVNHAEHEGYAHFLTWSVDDNITGWQAYLGKKCGGKDVTAIEAPARATPADVQGLPPAYIDVGELDMFRDEDLQYARVLGQGGVSCEFHLIPGANHAFEGFAPDSDVARFAMEQRYKVLKAL